MSFLLRTPGNAVVFQINRARPADPLRVRTTPDRIFLVFEAARELDEELFRNRLANNPVDRRFVGAVESCFESVCAATVSGAVSASESACLAVKAGAGADAGEGGRGAARRAKREVVTGGFFAGP